MRSTGAQPRDVEFRYAAEGNVDELRRWLQQHPDRVNLPSVGAHFTLVYTTVNNCHRTDIASIQSGRNAHMETLRMLCEEFNADLGAPNGGSLNTVVHLAAQLNQEEMLRYLLVDRQAPLRPNVFGEYPLELALRTGASEACLRLLREEPQRREAAKRQLQKQIGASGSHGASPQQVPPLQPPPPSSGAASYHDPSTGLATTSANTETAAPPPRSAGAALREQLKLLTIEDSDDDESDNDNGGAGKEKKQQQQQRQQGTAGGERKRGAAAATASSRPSTGGALSVPSESHSGSPKTPSRRSPAAAATDRAQRTDSGAGSVAVSPSSAGASGTAPMTRTPFNMSLRGSANPEVGDRNASSTSSATRRLPPQTRSPSTPQLSLTSGATNSEVRRAAAGRSGTSDALAQTSGGSFTGAMNTTTSGGEGGGLSTADGASLQQLNRSGRVSSSTPTTQPATAANASLPQPAMGPRQITGSSAGTTSTSTPLTQDPMAERPTARTVPGAAATGGGGEGSNEERFSSGRPPGVAIGGAVVAQRSVGGVAGDSSASYAALAPASGSDAGSPLQHPSQQRQQQQPSAASGSTSLLGNEYGTLLASTVTRAYRSSTQPVLLRSERDISNSAVFGNPDLQSFRSAFGDGFAYTQCRDHYEIRGLLPYKYRGVEYYTPVIINVFAPRPETQSETARAAAAAAAAAAVAVASSGGEGSPSTESSTSMTRFASTAPFPSSYSRYRVLLDTERMNDYAVCRKAEYLDPLSAAFIPSPADRAYTTLLTFLREAVIKNFEQTPPMIAKTSSYAFATHVPIGQLGSSTDTFRHHHSRAAPAYMKNVLGHRDAVRLRAFRILEDLSRFGDGLFSYSVARHIVLGNLPVLREQPVDVLATPSTRTNGAPPTSNNTRQCIAKEAEVVMLLRVRIQFTPNMTDGGAYDTPPAVYLLDATSSDPSTGGDADLNATAGTAPAATRRLMYTCFQSLLQDPYSGQVQPSSLAPEIDEWKAKGSLYDLLIALQKRVSAALESFALARRHALGFPTSSAAAAHGGASSPNAPPTGSPSSAASPLDNFFDRSPVSGTPSPSVDGAVGGQSSQQRCLLCLEHPKNIVLLPCEHVALCRRCAQLSENHVREGRFTCPVCRADVVNTLDVYL